MPKPKIPNQRKAQLEHKKRIERYASLIQKIYDNIAKEATRYAVLAGANEESAFSFSDYTLTKEAINQLQAQLISEVSAIIMRGTSEEWKESNLVQDLVAKKVLSTYTGTSKHDQEFSRYFETNPDSLKAFQERKDRGMNLSSRVWDLSTQYKAELEESITAAIEPGTSAMSLAAKVKQYLKYPDKRFRRIKEKLSDGTIKWHLSKNAKTFHPGQGVYRSSARNAQRLARTEINMAYRTAEQKRWEQFDFVVGYEVKTTQNGHHVTDICDTLAGKYPKTFKFMGWHPQCMCYSIPILKTEAELWAGDDVKSVNEVTDVPQGFKDWIRDNEERINAAEKRGNLPYFIRDNRDEVENVLHPELRKKPALELAAERHAARTEADIKDIQDRWDAKLQRDANTKMVANNVLKVAQSWSEVDYTHLEELIANNNLTAIKEEYRKVADAVKAMREEEKAISDIIPDVHSWHEQFSIAELKHVKEDVIKTMSKLDKSSLESFKSGLIFEADWVVKNSSYATKYVAESTYKNQIKLVEEKIYWREAKSASEKYISKLETVNPKLAKKISKDFDAAFANGNKKGVEAYIYNLSKWEKIIQLHSSLPNDGSIDIALFEKCIKDGKLNKAWQEYNKLIAADSSVDLEEYCKKHYRTNFDINSQESYEKRMPKLISDCHDAWINAPVEERKAIIDYTGSWSEEMIKDRAFGRDNERVKRLDSLLDKITLKEDLVLRSGQDFCVTGFIFGSDFESVLRTEDILELNKRFAGAKGVNNAYLSTSYNERGGFSKDIEFHIFAPKGTNGMVANQVSRCGERRGVEWDAVSHNANWSLGESEFILHGGLIYQFIKAELGTKMSDTGIRLYIQILGRK